MSFNPAMMQPQMMPFGQPGFGMPQAGGFGPQMPMPGMPGIPGMPSMSGMSDPLVTNITNILNMVGSSQGGFGQGDFGGFGQGGFGMGGFPGMPFNQMPFNQMNGHSQIQMSPFGSVINSSFSMNGFNMPMQMPIMPPQQPPVQFIPVPVPMPMPMPVAPPPPQPVVIRRPVAPPPPPVDPIAPGSDAEVWGDPHFVGFDGGKYDVMGENGNVYNILSDKGFQYNAQFDQWKGKKGMTIVSKAGLTVGSSKVQFEYGKTPKVNINGEGFQEMKHGETYKLDDGGTAKWDAKKKVLTVADGEEYSVDLIDRGDHLDHKVKIGKKGVNADGVMPHGLLGQTADGDGKARKGVKGSKQGEGVVDIVKDGKTQTSKKGDADIIVRQYRVLSLWDTQGTTIDNQDNAFMRFHDNRNFNAFVGPVGAGLQGDVKEPENKAA
ncbi:MAG: hypothetical protein KTR14_03585 [Vampirovibrio sp.]|nr:hypothetical protein [Vampirovibrio sp.]